MLVRLSRPLLSFALRPSTLISVRGYVRASLPVAVKARSRVSAKKTVRKTTRKVGKKGGRKAVSKKRIAKKKPIKKAKVKKVKKVKKVLKAKKRVAKKVPKPKPRLVPDKRVPRSPGNAFALFVKQNHSSHSADTATGRIRGLAMAWRQLAESEKNEWRSRAVAAQGNFERAYRQYINSLSAADVKKENAIRRKLRKIGRKSHTRVLVDVRRPKLPMPAFLRFAVANRDPEMGLTDDTKRLGQVWRNMGDSEKEKYLQQARADLSKYHQELAAYKSM